MRRPWVGHPGVRTGDELTAGERAADRLRNGMGSWTFVLVSLMFLAGWMALNGTEGFDPYPFILLNLVLSCLAALQGAILLIAARRSDQIASELARHDYEADTHTRDVVEDLAREVAALRAEQHALHALLEERLAVRPPVEPGALLGGRSTPAAQVIAVDTRSDAGRAAMVPSGRRIGRDP